MEMVTEGGVGCGETNLVEEMVEETGSIAGEEDHTDSVGEKCGFTVPEVQQH